VRGPIDLSMRGLGIISNEKGGEEIGGRRTGEQQADAFGRRVLSNNYGKKGEWGRKNGENGESGSKDGKECRRVLRAAGGMITVHNLFLYFAHWREKKKKGIAVLGNVSKNLSKGRGSQAPMRIRT